MGKIAVVEIILITILILFIAAAYQDYRKREVSDWLTAVAWGLSAFIFNLQYFVLFFAGAWLLALLSEKFMKPLMAWGDVLWLPIGASMIQYMDGNGLVMSLIAILASQVYLWYRTSWKNEPKEKINGSPFVLVLLIVVVVAYLFGAITQPA